MTKALEDLLPFATEAQAEKIIARIDTGGNRAAARKLGCAESLVRRAISSCQRKSETALGSGWVPTEVTEHFDEDGNLTGKSVRKGPESWAEQGGEDAGPARDGTDGYVIKGVSTYYNANGEQRGQWVKTRLDNAAHAENALRAFTDWLATHEANGRAEPLPPPSYSDDDLLTVYPIGDPHFGLHSWAPETGENFNLKEAERVTYAAVDRLVTAAAASGTAILLNLGDFFHADDSRNETPGHSNRLDVDGRYMKIVQVGMRTMVACVRRLLEKHARVIVRNVPGNHDPHLALLLSVTMDAFFRNEPRVTVDLSPSLYWYYRFGKVLIGAHHGHGAKPADLPLLMAADRPEDWGMTAHRHWLTGHIHHWTGKEHPGVIVESFRTLATKDAWHAGKGYRSGRDMNVITYHREFGEIQRTRCDIAQLA